MPFERENIQAMTGYTSGEQPDSADVIKLNTNENPYPPGPKVDEALSSFKAADLRRYPPPTASNLRACIAAHHALQADQVLVTNGGDELLRLIISTFVETTEAIGVAEPSYSLYPVLADAHGCQYIRFDLEKDWSLPQNFAQTLNQKKVKVCFVVNPHAPSGTLMSEACLRQLAQAFKGILVIDEAYVDFVDPALNYDATALVNELENVLILRTLSKGYSLAGLRMAYGLGSTSLIDPMQFKTKDSFNTDLISQTLALAALQDQDYAQQTWSQVRSQREYLREQLNTLGYTCPDSQSNFLLVTVPEEKNALTLHQGLKKAGILVRYFDLPKLQNKLRITIGTDLENEQLLNALKQL